MWNSSLEARHRLQQYLNIIIILIILEERLEYRMLIDNLYRGIVQTPYHWT